MLEISEAMCFVDDCEKLGTRILGVERFEWVDGRARPDVSGIADFSTLGVDDSILSAKDFLRQYKTGFFEFTLDDG